MNNSEWKYRGCVLKIEVEVEPDGDNAKCWHRVQTADGQELTAAISPYDDSHETLELWVDAHCPERNDGKNWTLELLTAFIAWKEKGAPGAVQSGTGTDGDHKVVLPIEELVVLVALARLGMGLYGAHLQRIPHAIVGGKIQSMFAQMGVNGPEEVDFTITEGGKCVEKYTNFINNIPEKD